MALVTIRAIENVFTAEQKEAAIQAITDALVAIAGAGMRPVAWVIFEEVKAENWAIGGAHPVPGEPKPVAKGFVTPQDRVGF